MWICRRCAAHVKDNVLECPRCAKPAPARLQPELANNVSDEMKDAPRSEQIHWLSLKGLPSLRKQAQSPWVWTLFGFVFGLGCGTFFRNASLPATAPELVLVQPVLCGLALAGIFGLLGALIRRRRRVWYNLYYNQTYPFERGVLFGFFLPLVLVVIDAFVNHQGWKSFDYLFRNLGPALGFSIILALAGGIVSGIAVPLLKIIADALGWRFGPKDSIASGLQRSPLAKTDSAQTQESCAGPEPSDKITPGLDKVLSQLDPQFGIQRKDD